MFQSIVSYGLAVGAVYALIGITYNVMFSASRVFSFTAGMLGMLGGVLGALFINKTGHERRAGVRAGAGLRRRARPRHRDLTVRPVLKSIEQHLYVLSTLAFALMVQQVTAIEFGTEAYPFPVLIPIGAPRRSPSRADPDRAGWLDQKFWLPVLACAVTIAGSSSSTARR